MRALITGGTGFVGANLVAGLNAAGHTARVLRRPASKIEALEGLHYEEAFGDILDPDSLAPAMADCDWVFHVAAVSDYWRQGLTWLYQVNVEGTRNVLSAARAAGVSRLVYTSSVAALGVAADGRPMDENHSFNISPRRFPYGHSKHLAELDVQKAVQAGLGAVIVNPAVVIGPRDLNKISGSIVAVTRGPRPLFSFPRWAIEPTALGVSLARTVLGNRVPINANQVRMSGQRIYVTTAKAQRELGLPQTPFRTAVERAYAWFREKNYL